MQESVAGGARWSVHPWRLVPPLVVLIAVGYIGATTGDMLRTNHWAYPLTLIVAGLVSLWLLVRARPRRIPPAVAYPGP